MNDRFEFDTAPIDLPTGAWSQTERRMLRWADREIVGLTQGRFRAYLYPVFSPGGYAVTSESPADHPHHHSIWIGSDHVNCLVPGAEDRHEEYTYNFYINETFQGRAAGRILQTAATGAPDGGHGFHINQELEWRGPEEWGAPEGRVIAHEQRAIGVAPGRSHHVIDISSSLTPAKWDLAIGPTRHAFFNIRVAESMKITSGGKVLDADGRSDCDAVSGSHTNWVDLSGPVGGDHHAGIAIMPHPGSGTPWWFVSDWGVLTVGHFRGNQKQIARGDTAQFEFRVIVHDGMAADLDLAALYRDYLDRPAQ